MLARPDARRKRTSADAARSAVMHGTVRCIASAKVPALHAAGKSLALADPGYIDQLPRSEAVNEHAVAHLRFVLGIVDAYFAELAHGRHVGLLEMSGHGLRDALRLDEFHQPQLR